jgi:outer membrane lipoprotein SlyB
VNRDSSARSKSAGLAAALVGALAGARLGFHAASDLLALVTAIAGAIAGANLTLILLDMSRARSARGRVALKPTMDGRRSNLEPAAPTGAG